MATLSSLRGVALACAVMTAPCLAQNAPAVRGQAELYNIVPPHTTEIVHDDAKGQDAVVAMIDRATTSLRVSVPRLISAYVATALANAQRRGVVVALLIGEHPFRGADDLPRPDERVLLDGLVKGGVAIRLGWLGSRTNSLIADQTRMVSGTLPLASPPTVADQSQLFLTYDSPRENTRLTEAFEKDWALATTYTTEGRKP